MALVPDPQWRVPTKVWDDVIKRYVHFRRVKGWRGRSQGEDGHVQWNRVPSKRALRLRRALLAKVTPLVESGRLPKSAYSLRQDVVKKLLGCFRCLTRDFDRAPSIVKHLWRALVLNHWGYTCRYCGRTAWDTHMELGAAIRFELDHRRAKARLGDRRDDFSTANVGLACRSCNVIKGQMTRYQFLKELRSLARAVTSRGGRLWLKRGKRSNNASHRTGAGVARSSR